MDSYLPTLTEPQRRWLRFGLLVLALVVLAELTYLLSPVLTPVLAAAAIAYILNPAVTWLERRGSSRLTIVIGIYVVGAAALVSLGIYAVTAAVAQAAELQANVAGYVDAIRSWWSASSASSQPSTRAALLDRAAPILKEHGAGVAGRLLNSMTDFLSNAMNLASALVLVPMYAFFFLLHFNGMVRAVREHLPSAYRDAIVSTVTITDRAMASFFRGRLLVCMVIAIVTGIGWTIVGVRYGLLLGALAGLFNLVPFMSMLSLPPAILFAYLEATQSGLSWLWPVILTFGVYAGAQALESLVLTPLIEARQSGLHPMTTVIVLLVGAQWAGLLGMLLAIPIASTLKTFAVQLLLPELRRLAAPVHPDAPPAAAVTGDSSEQSAEPRPLSEPRPSGSGS
ncbi:hypothetical protein RAS1_18930 [Phycisphaerae bacterium RAS1]|nr:hypothetical protein RAS1_18930 [Phycisphaerae bacterium RAS1]